MAKAFSQIRVGCHGVGRQAGRKKQEARLRGAPLLNQEERKRTRKKKKKEREEERERER